MSQTRLEKRSHRPEIENCNDTAHIKMVDEVSTIHDTIDQLNAKLAQAQENIKLFLKSLFDWLELFRRLKENYCLLSGTLRVTLVLNQTVSELTDTSAWESGNIRHLINFTMIRCWQVNISHTSGHHFPITWELILLPRTLSSTTLTTTLFNNKLKFL